MRSRRVVVALVAATTLPLGGCSGPEPVTLQCPEGAGEIERRPPDAWGSHSAMDAVKDEPSWGDDTYLVEGTVEDDRATIIVRRDGQDLGSIQAVKTSVIGWVVVSEIVCRGVTLPPREYAL